MKQVIVHAVVMGDNDADRSVGLLLFFSFFSYFLFTGSGHRYTDRRDIAVE